MVIQSLQKVHGASKGRDQGMHVKKEEKRQLKLLPNMDIIVDEDEEDKEM